LVIKENVVQLIVLSEYMIIVIYFLIKIGALFKISTVTLQTLVRAA